MVVSAPEDGRAGAGRPFEAGLGQGFGSIAEGGCGWIWIVEVVAEGGVSLLMFPSWGFFSVSVLVVAAADSV